MKYTRRQIQEAVQDKGYVYFQSPKGYDVNIIGIRIWAMESDDTEFQMYMPVIIRQSRNLFIPVLNNQNGSMLQNIDYPFAYESGVFCGSFDYDTETASIYVNQGRTTETSIYMNTDFVEYQYNKKEELEKIPQMGG